MPSGVEQSKQNVRERLEQLLGNLRIDGPGLEHFAMAVAHDGPIGAAGVKRQARKAMFADRQRRASGRGNTCRPASVSSRMARRMVPSASCRAFSSVPSKSLANILIMGVPLLRLHDIVDEGEACPNNAVPERRTTASTNSRCPSALRQSPQATFQPIKQHRRQRQHRQHACEYNRRCPSIICEPVNQLANRRCTGKRHINECQHFSAEFLWR